MPRPSFSGGFFFKSHKVVLSLYSEKNKTTYQLVPSFFIHNKSINQGSSNLEMSANALQTLASTLIELTYLWFSKDPEEVD